MRQLSVSLMCADLLNLEREIRRIEAIGVDYLHIDLMDGTFVPNLTFGPDTVNAIRRITDLPLDVHLLLRQPSVIVRALDLREGDILTIHSECQESVMENAAFVRQKGADFGLALNPDTSIEEVRKYLPYVDVVLLMLIVPGFAGTPMIRGMMEKVGETRRYLEERGCQAVRIAVDGSVSRERAKYMAEQGADIFIGGTAGVFRKGMEIEQTIPEFYQAIR